MGYIEKDLIPGEQIIYKTRLHSIVLIRPLFEAIVLIAFGILSVWGAKNEQQSNPSLLHAAHGSRRHSLRHRRNSRRLRFCKTQFRGNGCHQSPCPYQVGTRQPPHSRNPASKVESISVDESFWGRTLDYGTIVIRGTGGTPSQS